MDTNIGGRGLPQPFHLLRDWLSNFTIAPLFQQTFNFIKITTRCDKSDSMCKNYILNSFNSWKVYSEPQRKIVYCNSHWDIVRAVLCHSHELQIAIFKRHVFRFITIFVFGIPALWCLLSPPHQLFPNSRPYNSNFRSKNFKLNGYVIFWPDDRFLTVA